MSACNYVVWKWFAIANIAPSSPFLFPSLLTFHSLLSESVETPSSGGGPPTREWVLVGVAGGRQLGSNKSIKEKMDNMHRILHKFEPNRQALQENYSQQGLDRRVQDAEARAQDLQVQLEASQDAYTENASSLSKKHRNLSKNPSSLSKNHKLRKEISCKYSSRLHRMPTMNTNNCSNSPNTLSKQHKLRKEISKYRWR